MSREIGSLNIPRKPLGIEEALETDNEPGHYLETTQQTTHTYHSILGSWGLEKHLS